MSTSNVRGSGHRPWSLDWYRFQFVLLTEQFEVQTCGEGEGQLGRCPIGALKIL